MAPKSNDGFTEGVLPWPGVDGLTLDDVLRSCPKAATEGLVPESSSPSDETSRLAGEIEAFFGERDSE